ncbi:MAG: branched-chain amino acid ABC transporter permease [Alphaproteobacteria bacterium]
MLGVVAYLVFFLVIALTYSMICLGLNLQWGFTGLFNVGVAGFFAVGAYASAILTGPDYAGQIGGFGLPVPVGWLGAMAVAGLCGAVVAVPTLRLRHDYLAISTFGVAVSLQLVALNVEPLTGGPFGLNFVPRPLAGWFDDNLAANVFYLAVVALLTALVYVALERLVRSPWGRVLKAIREDEGAAASLGKHPFAFRLQAFVVGSAVIGLAGALYAHFVGFIAPEDFRPILTFQAWTMLIVGGSGNNRGAVVGGLVVWALWTASGALLTAVLPPELQARGAALQIVLIGVALAAVLLFRPRGLLGEEAVVSRHVKE